MKKRHSVFFFFCITKKKRNVNHYYSLNYLTIKKIFNGILDHMHLLTPLNIDTIMFRLVVDRYVFVNNW